MADIYTRDEYMQKILNLLKLAERGGTRAEAELALSKARELMLKHSIAEHELREKQSESTVEYRDLLLYAGKVRAFQHYLICHILNEYFNVTVYSYRIPHKETRTFAFGTPQNTQYAKYAHDFLVATFTRLWEDMKREHPFLGKEHSRSYYAGVADGFESTLRKQNETLSTEESTALVVIGKELQDATKQAHPELKSKPVKFNSDGKKKFFPGLKKKGEEDGKKIKVNAPLDAPKS